MPASITGGPRGPAARDDYPRRGEATPYGNAGHGGTLTASSDRSVSTPDRRRGHQHTCGRALDACVAVRKRGNGAHFRRPPTPTAPAIRSSECEPLASRTVRAKGTYLRGVTIGHANPPYGSHVSRCKIGNRCTHDCLAAGPGYHRVAAAPGQPGTAASSPPGDEFPRITAKAVALAGVLIAARESHTCWLGGRRHKRSWAGGPPCCMKIERRRHLFSGSSGFRVGERVSELCSALPRGGAERCATRSCTERSWG